jgi:predicted nuclease of predicted toxin-antitoxin system
MRVLFDQATPVPLRSYLKAHRVSTAAQEGWDRLKNGDLLAAAESAGFDVLVTTDKNMRYQQNLHGRKIAVLVLGKGRWPLIKMHATRVAAVIDELQPGTYVEVEISN